jgi:two-component system, chemotaxis family, protein-glutamate methylesterase/glutaminase
VILSGFDSDGAAALKSIKDEGGVVFAQEFRTARQPDMPKSAVRTGCVDYLLSPEEIAAQLAQIAIDRNGSHAAQAASGAGGSLFLRHGEHGG